MQSARLSEIKTALDGRYDVQSPLASGGMADLFLATDTRHERVVAIKVMRHETVGLSGQQRFLREISIVARLSHPNIVPLFDSGISGSLLFFVMPFIDGPSLRERLKSDGKIPVHEALGIAGEVARALEYAHQNGVVHRDIKPGNILLEAGHARVADFGVSKAAAVGDESLTTGDLTVGTVSYMSPEQATSPSSVDFRSDLYSLAVVTYEMLTGENPFRGLSFEEVLARKVLGTFTPMRKLDPSIPDHVDRTVSRALSPKPDDRFASADEFVSALRGESRVGEAPSRRRRSRRRAFAAVAATLALAAAGIAARHAWSSRTSHGGPVLGLGRIVVVPLYNGTQDPSLDVIGFAAGDWLTEGLQKTGILEVVPTTSAFEVDSLARQPTVPTRRLAEETDAETVVRGSYYRRGDSLLFQLKVEDQGGRRVAAAIGDVSAPIADPMRGIAEMRARLMGWFAVEYDERLGATATARPPTYAAYREFSEGMGLYVAGQNGRAWPSFLRAYALDSSFVQALLYASLAMTNTADWRPADSLLTVIGRRRESLNEYDRAWLDFRLAFMRGDVERTLAAMRTAARLAPGTKAAYNLAVSALQAGHIHEALNAIQTLQPDRGAMRGYASYWSVYGSVAHMLGDYDREYKIGSAALDAFPTRLIAFPPLIRSLAATGRLPELEQALARAENLPPDPYYWDYGLLLTEAAEELRAHGRPADAATYWHRLSDWLAPRDTTRRAHWRLVQTSYALGDLDGAEKGLATLRRNEPGNLDYLGMRGLLAARRGNRAEALVVVDSLERRNVPYEFGMPTLYRAKIEAVLGDSDKAIATLQLALAQGRPYQVWLHRDIDFEHLRSTPQFVRVVRGRD